MAGQKRNIHFDEHENRILSKTLEVIAGKWRLYIILILDNKTRRYTEISALLPTISPKVLAGELKSLVKLGVMHRTVFAEIPSRVEYTLTDKGQQAIPYLRQLLEVGKLFI